MSLLGIPTALSTKPKARQPRHLTILPRHAVAGRAQHAALHATPVSGSRPRRPTRFRKRWQAALAATRAALADPPTGRVTTVQAVRSAPTACFPHIVVPEGQRDARPGHHPEARPEEVAWRRGLGRGRRDPRSGRHPRVGRSDARPWHHQPSRSPGPLALQSPSSPPREPLAGQQRSVGLHSAMTRCQQQWPRQRRRTPEKSAERLQSCPSSQTSYDMQAPARY